MHVEQTFDRSAASVKLGSQQTCGAAARGFSVEMAAGWDNTLFRGGRANGRFVGFSPRMTFQGDPSCGVGRSPPP